MPRGPKDLRTRLQDAALALYRERGYDQTTTAEIAARAGVTERTFFRYFPDKREVLFEEDPRLRPTLSAAVAEAPAALAPLEVLRLAFRAIGSLLEENRPFTEPRAAVIAANPSLQERAEAKSAALTILLADGLRRRGVEDRLAVLAARTGMAAFSHAAQAWFEAPSPGLDSYLDQAFSALRGLSALDTGPSNADL